MAANPVILPVILALFSGIYGYIKWDDAPNPVPVWWNLDGQPIYYLSKWFGFTFLPILMVVIPYIVYLFASYDGQIKTQSGEPKHAIANLITLPALFFFAVHNCVILDAFVSSNGYISLRFLVATIALLLMIWVGYFLQYVQPNHTVGILTPWTLREEATWTKTHTHSAWILELLGLALLISAFFVPIGLPLVVVTLVLWLGSGFYLVIYSWIVSGSSNVATRGTTEPLLATEA